MNRQVLFIVLFFISFKGICQFTGGSQDGYLAGIYIQPGSPVYYSRWLGGNGDGNARTAYIQPGSPIYYSRWLGGIGDGNARTAYIQPGTPIYYTRWLGGIGDGNARTSFIQSGTPVYYSRWLGGIQDGAADAKYSMSGVPIQYAYFSGFIQDGYGSSSTPEIALPVELISFNGNCETVTGNIILHWTTASETNCDYYQVAFSEDMVSWRTIGKVKGAGNSTTELEYTCIDSKVTNYNTPRYYQLTQFDHNGTFHIYPAISVTCGEKNDNEYFSAFISPEGKLNLLLKNDVDLPYNIELFDARGQLVLSNEVNFSAKQNQYSCNISNCAKGIYLLRLSNQLKQYTIKVPY